MTEKVINLFSREPVDSEAAGDVNDTYGQDWSEEGKAAAIRALEDAIHAVKAGETKGIALLVQDRRSTYFIGTATFDHRLVGNLEMMKAEVVSLILNLPDE